VELSRWVRAHLEARRLDQAIFWGRALVLASPQDASAYLLLGSALIDAGKPKEARELLRRCGAQARQGDVSECLAFGGR
jgi:Flp pilus assembly protein TadD